MGELRYINTGDLCVAYEDSDNAAGTTIILMHGFPYDIRAYDEVTEIFTDVKTVGSSFLIYADLDLQGFYQLTVFVRVNKLR